MAGQIPTYPQPDGRQPAPGRLAILQDFVNAHFAEAPEADRDRPVEPLSAWLAHHRLPYRGSLSRRETAALLGARDALRSLLEAHHGGQRLRPAELRDINALAGRSPLRLEFDAIGAPTMAPADGEAVAALLAIVGEAAAAGTWARLKICRADDCRWAFYDASRNRSGAWCSMSDCGNRAKARSFRARHRT